jgi:serine/threonine-protein kinase SRPK3
MLRNSLLSLDFHEGNILLRLPRSIDPLAPDLLYERCGQPDEEPAQRLDGQPISEGVPSHRVVATWLGVASEDLALPESQLLIADFSESFRPDRTPRYHTRTPQILRPPEAYLEPSVPLSFPADIRGLACAVFAVLGQHPLFDTWFPSEDKVVKEQVDALGRLPADWWAR